MATKWHYWIPSIEERDDSSNHVKAFSAREAAEVAADHFHRCRDGWEWNDWPLEFAVAKVEDNGDVGPPEYFSVDRDVAPVFTACKPRSNHPLRQGWTP